MTKEKHVCGTISDSFAGESRVCSVAVGIIQNKNGEQFAVKASNIRITIPLGIVKEILSGKENIPQSVESIVEDMCNNYCKWPEKKPPAGKTEDWLFEDPDSPCANCPLNRLT